MHPPCWGLRVYSQLAQSGTHLNWGRFGQRGLHPRSPKARDRGTLSVVWKSQRDRGHPPDQEKCFYLTSPFIEPAARQPQFPKQYQCGSMVRNEICQAAITFIAVYAAIEEISDLHIQTKVTERIICWVNAVQKNGCNQAQRRAVTKIPVGAPMRSIRKPLDLADKACITNGRVICHASEVEL